MPLAAPSRSSSAAAVGGVLLAETAEVDLHACVRQRHRLRRSLHAGQPICATASASAYGVGMRALRKSHARRNTPEVISNRPPLSAWSCAAKSSSCEVSASTSTAAATTGSRVDARDDAVGPVARIFVLDATHFGDRDLSVRSRQRAASRRGALRGGSPWR